jgi:hypothetical protein
MYKPFFFVVALSAFAAVTAPAFAKPVSQGGCDSKQLEKAVKTKGGKKCVDLSARDLQNGSTSNHDIYCSSSGKYLCCEFKDSKIVNGSCETIKEFRKPAQTVQPLTQQKTARPAAGAPTRPLTQPNLLEGTSGLATTGPAATGAPLTGAPSTPAAPAGPLR